VVGNSKDGTSKSANSQRFAIGLAPGSLTAIVRIKYGADKVQTRTTATIPNEFPVSAEIYGLILTGQEAANTVKGLNVHGSSNQTQSDDATKRTNNGVFYIDSKKWAEKKRYLDKIESIESQDTSKRKYIDKSNIWSRPKRIFDVVSVLGSANCDGLGAMTYALCRDWLPQECFSAWVATDWHTFCIIGRIEDISKLGGNDNLDNWVVVDAWTLSPTALLYKHSDWQGNNLSWYSLGRGKGRGRNNPIRSSIRAEIQRDLNQLTPRQIEIRSGKFKTPPVYGWQDPWNDEIFKYVPIATDGQMDEQSNAMAVDD
jgi:hypothetical protein